MALSESSRSQIYQGLVNFVGEEAIGEMMSHFPARDVEEPVTKEFLRAEIADVRSEIAEVRGDINGVRGEIAGLRGEINGLRHMMVMNAGLVASVGAVIIAAIRL